MIKRSGLLILFLILMIVVAGCGSQAPPPAAVGEEEPAVESEPTTELTGTYTVSLGHEPPAAMTDWAKKFKELAEQKLPGQLEIVIYPEGQLGSQREHYEQVQMGALDMTIGSAVQSSFEPLYAAFVLPFAFRDTDHAVAVFNSEIPAELNERLISNSELRTVTIFDAGFRSVANNIKPIETPEDLAGLKIRTPNNPLRIEMFNALGAAATPMPFGDVFMSLQTRIVDGAELPVSDFYDTSLYETLDYLSLTNHVFTAAYVVARDDWYQELPEPVRIAVQEAADEATLFYREFMIEAQIEYLKKLEDSGMIINEVDTAPFVEIMQEKVWQEQDSELLELLERIVDIK